MHIRNQILLLLIFNAFVLSKGFSLANKKELEKIRFPFEERLILEPDVGPKYFIVSRDLDFPLLESNKWSKTDNGDFNKNLKIIAKKIKTGNNPVGSLILQASKIVIDTTTIFQESLNFLCQDSDTIKAASYNLRYDPPEDEASGNGWYTRKIPLVDIITDYDFDIIGTQEGDFSQMNDLMALLPKYDYKGYKYGGKVNDSVYNHTASIVYKKTKFVMLDEGVFWYSETPDEESIGWDATDTRICTWAKMKIKSSGRKFYFFTSHFYWRYETAKRNSGHVLVSKIKEIAKEDLPVISTGDFNSTSGSPQIRDLKGFLKDSYEITEAPPSGPEKTAFRGGQFQGKPSARIDYIFVNEKIRVLSYTALDDTYENSRYPSDHLPIVAKILLLE